MVLVQCPAVKHAVSAYVGQTVVGVFMAFGRQFSLPETEESGRSVNEHVWHSRLPGSRPDECRRDTSSKARKILKI